MNVNRIELIYLVVMAVGGVLFEFYWGTGLVFCLGAQGARTFT
jgi:hypothetical protein